MKLLGPDKEEGNCSFGPHPWVDSNVLNKDVKDYNLLTVCVNHERRYLGQLSFWNILNKWTKTELQGYTAGNRIRTPAACPSKSEGRAQVSFDDQEIFDNPHIFSVLRPGRK